MGQDWVKAIGNPPRPITLGRECHISVEPIAGSRHLAIGFGMWNIVKLLCRSYYIYPMVDMNRLDHSASTVRQDGAV